jgi:DNA-binding MarR family transcriptional regulator
MLTAKQASKPSLNSAKALLLDNQLCFAMYSTSLAMTKLYKPLLADLDLTYPQYLVMLVLWETDSLTVSSLGERLYLDSGTLTPLLKRMEQSGLLARVRSARDERRVEVSLTNVGRKLKARAAAVPGCVLEASQCSIAELKALTAELKGLRERLNA